MRKLYLHDKINTELKIYLILKAIKLYQSQSFYYKYLFNSENSNLKQKFDV